MHNLTIKITDISSGKEKGYSAVIKELGNSVIYGDSIADIFKVIPEVIKSAQKNGIGVFGKNPARVGKAGAGQY